MTTAPSFGHLIAVALPLVNVIRCEESSATSTAGALDDFAPISLIVFSQKCSSLPQSQRNDEGYSS